MVKVRIKEIADELGIKSKDVIEKAHEIGIAAKAAGSAITDKDAESLMNYVLTGEKPPKEEPAPPKKQPAPKAVQKTEESEKPAEKEVEVAPQPAKEESVEEASTDGQTTQAETPKQEEVAVTPTVEKEASLKAEVEQQEAAKPVEKKEEPVASSSSPATAPKESLATASLKRRRGLVIVKKKKPQKLQSSTSERFDGSKNEVIPKVSKELNIPKDDSIKKKKKTKKTSATKKDQSSKLDLLADREFGMGNLVDIHEDEHVSFMPDFVDIVEERKEEPKPTQPKRPAAVGRRGNAGGGGNRKPNSIKRNRPKKKIKKTVTDDGEVTSIEIPEECRVYEFAEKVKRPISDIIKSLFLLGMMVTKNDFLDKDMIEVLAEEFGVEVVTINPLDEFDYEKDYDFGSEEEHEERPPVITIMGHVDHGKTSLLDYIRNSKVADREVGGITQHVGAYMVEKDGKKITFMDTPGHEAFTHIRSRGAQVTDIVIIVVAADDGVKPQTKEAVDHAKAAGVPIIVAINKMDKEGANPDMAKSQMAEIGITPSEWGGEYDFIPVSAKRGDGIDDLLETILLQAELLELSANPEAEARAVVIESTVEKGRGPVATLIVQNGTLRVGDSVVAGVAYGKVRALLDDHGRAIKSVTLGEPCVVVGLSTTPSSGDTLVQMANEKSAREFAQKRSDHLRQKELSKSTKVTLDDLGDHVAEGKLKRLPIILKADAQGSLEAIKGSLEKIVTDETKIDIILSGIGNISESDVSLASASENGLIYGFHVKPESSAKSKAKSDSVEIKTYSIIYDLIDDVKLQIAGMLSPIIKEEDLGQAEVREVFMVPKIGAIAGCMVINGKIERNSRVRLLRGGEMIHEGALSSLKHFKDDVKEVKKGLECGIGLDGFDDIQAQDIIEVYKEVEEMATLD
jgi:translation initiation factor IF-2